MIYHRVFKNIKERIDNGENIFFIYGDHRFIYDLFYTKVNEKGLLLPLRESLIECFKEYKLIDKVLEIYYEDGKINLKSSQVLKKSVKIKDELGVFKDDNKELKSQEYNDTLSLINEIKSLNLNTLKEGKWLVVFDDFNQIAKIYKGFDNQEVGRFFSEVVLSWRKISNNYYIFLIRDKELGWLEDFGINKDTAIEVLEPSVHEVALTMHMIAKNNNKILLFPLNLASKYVENPKPLKIIVNEFKEKVAQTMGDIIEDTGSQEENIKLSDVKLPESVRNRIKDIFDKFKEGKSVTNGIIFYGPPGTGKTTIAKALANEAGSYFLKTSASDFKGEYLGQSVQNTRRIFEKLKLNKPAVLFIDEADAILTKRSSKDWRIGDSYSVEIVNEFLANVDGLKSDKEIFVIIATNFLDRLDDAIISRFEKIEIPLPEGEVLRDIVKKYLGSEFEQEYELFYGLSGRDISQLGKQWKEGVLSNKKELIQSITKRRLIGLEPIQPEINFSNVCGYSKQKELVKKLFDKNINKIIIFGKPKVGKTFFIEAIAGEFGLTMIKNLPENKEKLFGIADKVILYSKNSLPQDLERFPNLAVAIEFDEISEEELNHLRMLGFVDIKLEIDEETVREYVKNKFGIALSEDTIKELTGKSFPYIENKIKILIEE